MIKVQNLEKSFLQASQKIQVLKGIHFETSSSQTLSIIGPSGSGKTTLLSLLAGLEQPDHGNIIIHGHNLQQMSESELVQFRAKHIGIIFQQYYLMPHLTALENVMLPLEIARDKNATQKAKKQLDYVGLSHRLNHLPRQMSGGECQRTAIARASVIKPHVLLADEPSGNLDANSGEQAMNLLFSLVKESPTILILVTHNPELAQRCRIQMKLIKGTLQGTS